MKDTSESESLHLKAEVTRGRASGLTAAEIIALALSAVWLLAVTVFMVVVGRPDADGGADPLRGLTVAVAIFMPVGLIWVAVIASNSARAAREDSRRVSEAVHAMRQTFVAQNQASGTVIKPSFEKKLDEIVAEQRKTGAALATFTSIRAAAPADHPADPSPLMPAGTAPEDAQSTLALSGTGEETARPIRISDFITALNFPETAEDAEGFRALRRAMRDRRAAEVIRASQDILTLLSQEGIYMDDLSPDRARPELWRRFAQGERGRTMAALGGIRDRSGIALTAARMRQDHVFRDTAHHFLRKFDHTFAEFEKHADDAEIAALTDTRTARAFMLLGRVAGTFD